MYAIIGKGVKDNQIFSYRFLDLDSKAVQEVPLANLYDFMKGHKTTNARIAIGGVGGLEFIWQSIFTIPTYFEDGTVTNYLFKVLADRRGVKQWIVANVLGSTNEVTLGDSQFYKAIKGINSMIVDTKSKVTKFTMQLDGKFTSKEISRDEILNIEPVNAYVEGVPFNGKVCEHDYETSFYVVSTTDLPRKIVLGGFSGTGLTVITYTNESYSLSTLNYNDVIGDSGTYSPNCIRLNFTSLMFVGIDGLVVIGMYYNNFNTLLLTEMYERMLALDPENAERLKEGLVLGANQELLSCNLAFCNIPEGITKVMDKSLYVDYSANIQRFRDDLTSGVSELVIPESVESFSNTAFNNGNTRFHKVLQFINIIVENPNIGINVVNSLIQANITLSNVKVSGDYVISTSAVKRAWDSVYRFNLLADNLQVKKVLASRVNSLFHQELNGYQVLPYSREFHKEVYSVIILKSYQDFVEVYAPWMNRLKDSYKKFKKDYMEADKYNNWSQDRYKDLYRRAENLCKEYKAITNMVMHTAIKEGDKDSYKKVIDSLYTHRENMYKVFEEKLLCVASKYGFRHILNK